MKYPNQFLLAISDTAPTPHPTTLQAQVGAEEGSRGPFYVDGGT